MEVKIWQKEENHPKINGERSVPLNLQKEKHG